MFVGDTVRENAVGPTVPLPTTEAQPPIAIAAHAKKNSLNRFTAGSPLHKDDSANSAKD
jgi:hypothetical protein